MINKIDIIECVARMRCIVITPAGRGGSLLLQSLLDGHSQVVVLPDAPLGYHYFSDFCASNFDLELLLDNHAHIIDGSNAFADRGGEFSDNLALKARQLRPHFESAFRDVCDALGGVGSLNRVKFMSALHVAWGIACGQDVKKLLYFVFHHHNNRKIFSDLPMMVDDYPGLKLVVTCRHPIENALSFKIVDKRDGIPSFHNFSRNVRGWSVGSFLNVFKLINARIVSRDSLRLIDLGDLHLRQVLLLRSLSEWLGIDPDPVLERATVVGIPWMGNSGDGLPIPTFERSRSKLKYPDSIGDSSHGLTVDEYRFTRWYTRPILNHFGYVDDHGQSEVSFSEFVRIFLRNIEWEQPESVYYGRGIRKILRRFGIMELLLTVLQLIEMRRIRSINVSDLRL